MSAAHASPRHVLRRAPSADGELSASLAPERVADGARLLGWVALAYAIGHVSGPFARLVFAMRAGRVHDVDLGVPDLVAVAAVLMSLGVFAAVRRGVLPSKKLLDLGLVFQVVGALGLAVREFWHGPVPVSSGWFFVPAECILLVAYPLLVPNTPRKILAASLLAASMGPLGLAISAWAHVPPFHVPVFESAVYFLTTTYSCALIAYAVARVLHGVNQQLKDARDIGSYELVERIGVGGMGEVWRAQHRLLARPAAIKLIRGGLLGESARTRQAVVGRFEREARETAALGSIHTVQVYDYGATNEGDFYYVMELLEGLSVERLVREFGPVDPTRTVYLLRQACHSLGEAHRRGLVHRDVKPANLFVCRLGPDDDFVKVLDFGLVKQTSLSERTTRTALSIEGTAVGTPGYMAPEIAVGANDVDGRSDLYSLGCVAYYMLTGQPVFIAESAVATAIAHVQNPPVPPSLRSEYKIPPALDALILECLAKAPADRPASAEALSERLAAAVLPARWTDSAARAWWDRHQPCTRLQLARPQTHAAQGLADVDLAS